MSDRPTPLTDALWQAWADERLLNGQFRYGPADLADHARDLERQRDAYAETLREIAAMDPDWTVIIERHPELANSPALPPQAGSGVGSSERSCP